MKIKSVVLFFPMSECGEELYYEVGKNGVSSILRCEAFDGHVYYQIYKDDKLYSDVYHYSQVVYE